MLNKLNKFLLVTCVLVWTVALAVNLYVLIKLWRLDI
jgi:hypothetical protein